MDALGRMLEAVPPGGLVLDLQLIRPNPEIEVHARRVATIDGEPVFEWADAATAAVEARIAMGDLVEEAVEEHEVFTHYADAAELVDEVAESRRCLPAAAVPLVLGADGMLIVRERCRLRRLRLR